jgi:hypothetical protein
MRKTSILIVCAAATSTLACQDLDISNPNNPDREVVVTSASDIEALISSSFRRWFNLHQNVTPTTAQTVMADEFSTGFLDFGGQHLGEEPRNPIDNGPVSPNSPNRVPISTLYSIISAVNIGVQAIDRYDLRLVTGTTDNTQRALAFAKFVQGISHAQAALLYDKSWVYSETVDTDTVRFGGGSTHVHDLIKPYAEVRDTALAQLREALRIAESNTFTLPGNTAGDWIPGVSLTSQQFARVINSYIARTMVYTARTPQERAAVDWAKVIQHIDAGITADFAPLGTPGVMESGYKHRASRHRTTTPGDFMRVDYMVVGPADQSTRFTEWHNRPWSQRTPFVMVNVQDRRIIANPTSNCTTAQANALATEGRYMGCHSVAVFAAARGTGQQSFYYYHRLGRQTTWDTGPLVIMTVDEMNLLKAEGLIRLGPASATAALPLINRTRVANGGLPPVTIDGAPEPNCTPRKLNGGCGSLWDALRYEKRMEMIGVDAGVAHWDARGWGALAAGTPLHFPMPGNELELLTMQLYTTGGGQSGSASAPDPERCPVALPRCP